MRIAIGWAAVVAGCFTLWGADWLTDGGNPQRTGWQKDEKILGTANVQDMKLRWKLQPSPDSEIFSSLAADGDRLFVTTRTKEKGVGEHSVIAIGE